MHRGDVVASATANRADELVHCGVGFNLHQSRDLDSAHVAHAREIVSQQVNDHQIFCTVLDVALEGERGGAACGAACGASASSSGRGTYVKIKSLGGVNM